MGRIGRAAFKQIIEDGTLELAVVNDLVSAEELAYLLKHDSVYGRYERDVRAQNGRLFVDDGQSCVALNERSLDKPVPVVSIADIGCLVARPTSVNEVNCIFRDEAGSVRYRDIVGVSDEAIVSTDIIHDPRASIIDCTLTPGRRR
jgi:glyceraldehyde-3-phosphate dehydrogenase/erythrose-4-phosphate dehydrogenase